MQPHDVARPLGRRTRRSTVIAVLASSLLATGIAGSPALAIEGQYNLSVSPSSVEAGSTGNTLTFTFVAAAKSTHGAVTIQVPAGWTAPQRSNPGGPGYVTTSQGTCASVALKAISGTGPWTITIKAKCANGKSFTATYGPATAATGAGAHVFTASKVALQPAVTVEPGPAVALALGGTGDGPAGANRTVNFMPLDAYGNVATSYRGTIHFTGTGAAGCSDLPTNYTFTGLEFELGGVIAKSYRMRCAGEQTLTATDTVDDSVSGDRTFTISPLATDHLSTGLVAVGGAVIAGQRVTLSMPVRAEDAFGNLATGDNGAVDLIIEGFGYEPTDAPTSINLLGGQAAVTFGGHITDSHAQFNVTALRDGILGSGSITDVNSVAPNVDHVKLDVTPSLDGINYDAHLLLRPADPIIANVNVVMLPIVKATSNCLTNPNGSCTLSFEGKTTTGSSVSGSMVVGAPAVVETGVHAAADAIGTGDELVVTGCLEYDTNTLPVNVNYQVPETGDSLVIPENLCQAATSDFALVKTGVLGAGSSFIYVKTNTRPLVVYGTLDASGIVCTDPAQVYTPNTNSCGDDF